MKSAALIASILILAASTASPDEGAGLKREPERMLDTDPFIRSGTEDAGLRSDLEKMNDTDQSIRAGMEAIKKQHGSGSAEMKDARKRQDLIDAENIAWLDKIVEVHGWPGRALAGEKGAEGAFLVVQHADLAHQKKYFPLLSKAASAGELNRGSLALLEDRILMYEGKKQIYGSQTRTNAKGTLEIYPIKDAKNVDKRRLSVGLKPLAEYAKSLGAEYRPR